MFASHFPQVILTINACFYFTSMIIYFQNNFPQNHSQGQPPLRFCIYCKRTVACGRLKQHLLIAHRSLSDIISAIKLPQSLQKQFFDEVRKPLSFWAKLFIALPLQLVVTYMIIMPYVHDWLITIHTQEKTFLFNFLGFFYKISSVSREGITIWSLQ